MTHFVLNDFNRRRESGNQMMRVGIEADNDGIGQKLGDFFIGALPLEKVLVDAGQKILLEPADGFRSPRDGPLDPVLIEFDERPIPLLYFNDAILNSHAPTISGSVRKRNAFSRWL